MQVSCGFSGHLEWVLGLSRLRSEEASGEMQVSCGLDTKNCRKKHVLPFISVFCVRVCFYVCLCVCVFVIEYVVCVYFFYCCFAFSFNVLLELYLQLIYSMCKYIFQNPKKIK